jgi:anti-sigma factor (TIGR02949 family)
MSAFWKLGRRSGRYTPPGGISCGDVVAQLYEYIDEELEDAETVQKIREHLELCKRCYPHYDFERAFLRFLAEQGRACAPPELKRNIFERILEEESRG